MENNLLQDFGVGKLTFNTCPQKEDTPNFQWFTTKFE
jgi:hypothetical protein